MIKGYLAKIVKPPQNYQKYNEGLEKSSFLNKQETLSILIGLIFLRKVDLYCTIQYNVFYLLKCTEEYKNGTCIAQSKT
jgi:hypothetical protein